MILYTAELGLVNAILKAELLELAGSAANAGETLAVVVREQKLKVSLSGLVDSGIPSIFLSKP